MRYAIAAALAASFVCLAAPGRAIADDRAVKATWHASDGGFRTLDRDLRRAARRWRARDLEGPRPLLRLAARGRRLAHRTAAAVRMEEPSTDSGITAKDYVLRSLRSHGRRWRLIRRGVRLVARGRPRGFQRFVDAQLVFESARHLAEAARRLFERAEDEPPLSPALRSPG